jgi:uncharacterized surface anchored protein
LTKRLIVLFLISVFTVGAQEYRGTILGRVLDPTGAAVVGASIAVQNVETKVTVKTASNETGNYQVPFVLPGDYTVVVELADSRRSNGGMSASPPTRK